MSVAQAYDDGKKAFLEGRDINHVPGHYTPKEQELFTEGYLAQEACIELDDQEEDFEDINPDDLEDLSISELDFN
jgi:hypothetical protein